MATKELGEYNVTEQIRIGGEVFYPQKKRVLRLEDNVAKRYWRYLRPLNKPARLFIRSLEEREAHQKARKEAHAAEEESKRLTRITVNAKKARVYALASLESRLGSLKRDRDLVEKDMKEVVSKYEEELRGLDNQIVDLEADVEEAQAVVKADAEESEEDNPGGTNDPEPEPDTEPDSDVEEAKTEPDTEPEDEVLPPPVKKTRKKKTS